MRRCVAGFQGDSAAQARDTGGNSPFGAQCYAKIDPGGRKIGTHHENALVTVDGLIQFALSMP